LFGGVVGRNHLFGLFSVELIGFPDPVDLSGDQGTGDCETGDPVPLVFIYDMSSPLLRPCPHK
jgi:hypothetical protein